MNKFILYMSLLFTSVAVNAHGIDRSTIVFVQNEDAMWTIQVRAALDAYRKEVRTNFSESPYTTPEEFQEQLLKHFQNTLKITANNGQIIRLDNGMVKLGHETTVFFDRIKLPEDIVSIHIEGRMFEDIYKNKTKVIFLKKGFEKKKYTLNKNNDFTIDLVLTEESIALKLEEKSSVSFAWIAVPIAAIVGSVFFLFRRRLKSNDTDDLWSAKNS